MFPLNITGIFIMPACFNILRLFPTLYSKSDFRFKAVKFDMQVS